MADYMGRCCQISWQFSTILKPLWYWILIIFKVFLASDLMNLVDMENYDRGKRIEEEIKRENIPIPKLPEDFTWMKVTTGGRMRSLLNYAIKSMTEGKQVLWTGTGSTIGKTISCAEILKRKFNAYQITKICYKKVEEYWEPRTPALETLIVRRDIPMIHILLSREPLDPNEPGYQSPEKNKKLRGENKGSAAGKQDTNPFRAKRRAEFLKVLTTQK